MGEWESMYGNSEADNDAFYDMLDSSYEAERRSERNEPCAAKKEKEKFVPRWGKSIFDCKYCGAENMQWAEVAPDSWKPFDLVNDCVHICSAKHPENLTKDEVLERFQDMGFEAYVPRTSSWKYVFIASNKTQSLYFLIGRRGIDFKFYEFGKETKQDSEGKLYTDGGVFIRNYYKQSDVNVHKLVLDLASLFVSDCSIGEQYFIPHGSNR